MEQLKDPKQIARYSNEVISKNKRRFTKPLTNTQHKVLSAIEINQKHKHSLLGMTWVELSEFVGIVDGDKYNQTKRNNTWKELLEVSIQEEEMFYPMFIEIGLDKNGLFKYEINPKIEKFFDQPEKNYYLKNLAYIKPLKLAYSIPLYELLNKELHGTKKTEHNFQYDFLELKKYLGLSNKYKVFKDFKKKVLEPSLEEISNNTDINIKGFVNSRTKRLNRSSKQSGTNNVFIKRVSRKSTAKEQYLDNIKKSSAEEADYKEIVERSTIQIPTEPVFNDETWVIPSEETKPLVETLPETDDFFQSEVFLSRTPEAQEQWRKAIEAARPKTKSANAIKETKSSDFSEEQKREIAKEYVANKRKWKSVCNKYDVELDTIKSWIVDFTNQVSK